MRIAIGADHAGYPLKAHLVTFLAGAGHEVDDVGTSSIEPVDYPPYCAAVGRRAADGRADAGIVLGGSGQGEQLAANKVRGVRAALCNDLYTARMAREHNDANVLSMGARIVAPGLAEEIVELFVGTDFAGQRHQRRVDQVMALDGFELHDALYTTASTSRLAPDPIAEDVMARIVDAAVRGPAEDDQPRCRFLTVAATATKARLATWFGEGLAEPPVVLFVFGPVAGESFTLPVAWTACLAARAEGVAAALTVPSPPQRADVGELLGVPADGEWEPHALVALGYPVDDWAIVPRPPAHHLAYQERWGSAPDWRADEPLWPPGPPPG